MKVPQPIKMKAELKKPGNPPGKAKNREGISAPKKIK